MKKFLIGSALIWATALPAFGQAKALKQPQKHVQVQAVAARPEDVASIEAIVKASYETISGGVGVPASGDATNRFLIRTSASSQWNAIRTPARS